MVEKKGFVHRMADYAKGALTRWTGDTPSPVARHEEPYPHSAAMGTDGGSEGDVGPESSGKRFLTAALMREWTESAQAILNQTYDYNPDDLIQTKGKHVKIYQDMVRDPYVKAGLAIKKLSLLRLPRTVLPASTSKQDVEIARFVEDQFECMTTPWHTLLWGMMDCVNIGYSIGEINYRILDRGEWAGKIGWDTVKSKDPYVYSFRIKKNGDVDRIVQRIGKFNQRGMGFDAPTGPAEYPPDKFLISSFQPLYSNPYGSSDLRAAYRAYFIKDWAWKFRAIFMEKWGSPTVVGTFPNGTSEVRRQQLEDVLESIQQETTLTIPEDLKIEIIRVATTANITEYERAIADLNKEILVGILGSFLAVEEGKRTGARAQGQVHLWIAKLFIEALVYEVQEDLNRQMIRRLVDLNYPMVEKYPLLKFELSRVEDLLAEMELDAGLQTMGYPIDEAYITKKYERPVPGDKSLALDGRQDGDTKSKVLVPMAIKQAQMRPAFGADGKGPARGENPKAAGPDDKPSTKLAEDFRGVFDVLREDALPPDPQKIGPLKDNYAHMIRTWGALRHQTFAEGDAIAFVLAGEERAFRQKTGAWMTADQAYAAFLSRTMKG